MSNVMTAQRHLDDGRMARRQWIAVAVAILVNAVDGYDNAAISFAAPSIVAEWALSPDRLGWLLSMELLGMAVGSLWLGRYADSIGRRPTILACLCVMTAGMLAAAFTDGPVSLCVTRLATGLGIGGMLSALAALVKETSNRKNANLALALMLVGYSLGAVLGGFIARYLLVSIGWRSVFLFGAVGTAAALPIVIGFLPESVAWLERRQPANALSRINATLSAFGHPQVRELPAAAAASRSLLAEIFKPPYLLVIVCVTLAYVLHISCHYFVMKWLPNLVVSLGYPIETGADALIAAMSGAVAGGLFFGHVTRTFDVRYTALAMLAGCIVSINCLANFDGGISGLMASSAAFGFFSNAAGIGFYALLAIAFPPELRATATGFGIGVGRSGAAVGPILSGYLLAAGVALPVVVAIMSGGTLAAIGCLLVLRLGKSAPADRPELGQADESDASAVAPGRA